MGHPVYIHTYTYKVLQKWKFSNDIDTSFNRTIFYDLDTFCLLCSKYQIWNFVFINFKVFVYDSQNNHRHQSFQAFLWEYKICSATSHILFAGFSRMFVEKWKHTTFYVDEKILVLLGLIWLKIRYNPVIFHFYFFHKINAIFRAEMGKQNGKQAQNIAINLNT